MDEQYIKQIKRFEGFTPKAKWDFKHWTVGYGTISSKGEVVTEAEADRRLRVRLALLEGGIDKTFGKLPAGTRAALVSLSHTVGTRWMQGTGLAAAVHSGKPERIAERFRLYNKAGGTVRAGLVKRRDVEARWIV